MAHRLGSLVAVTPAREFGPGSGTEIVSNTWEETFTATAPASGTTRFVILHFAGVVLNAGDSLIVPPQVPQTKKLIKSGWTVAPGGAGLVWGSGLDYAIVQIETPPAGLGVPALPIRADLPPVAMRLFQ